MQSIGEHAFHDCHLTSVNFATGSKLKTIGLYAFGFNYFTSITIPTSVESIGDNALEGCSSLTSVTIPSSVQSIGKDAFNECTSLATVTCWATTPPTLGSDVFKYYSGEERKILPELTAIYVPSGAVTTYKGATNWSTYSSIITAIPDLTGVTANAANAAYWCTYYSSIANVQVDDNTTIYTISNISGTTATLSEVSGKIIKAGEGVVLKKTAGGDISLAYTATDFQGDYSSNKLAGVDVATTISGSAYANKVIYTLASGSNGLGLYKYYDNVSDPVYTTNTTLGANKAFLALESAASARGFTFTFDDGETTGISDVRSNMSDGVYYDLQGRRVAQPTKGLYIKDGKKIMVK